MIRPIEPRDVPAVLELIAETLAEFGLTFGRGSTTDDELRQLPGAYVDRGGMFCARSRFTRPTASRATTRTFAARAARVATCGR